MESQTFAQTFQKDDAQAFSKRLSQMMLLLNLLEYHAGGEAIWKVYQDLKKVDPELAEEFKERRKINDGFEDH